MGSLDWQLVDWHPTRPAGVQLVWLTSPDERHVVFECPALQHLRAEYDSLFQRRFSMRGFMWQPGAVQVARFVAACPEAMTVDAL